MVRRYGEEGSVGHEQRLHGVSRMSNACVIPVNSMPHTKGASCETRRHCVVVRREIVVVTDVMS